MEDLSLPLRTPHERQLCLVLARRGQWVWVCWRGVRGYGARWRSAICVSRNATPLAIHGVIREQPCSAREFYQIVFPLQPLAGPVGGDKKRA